MTDLPLLRSSRRPGTMMILAVCHETQYILELETNLREILGFTITEKAPSYPC